MQIAVSKQKGKETCVDRTVLYQRRNMNAIMAQWQRAIGWGLPPRVQILGAALYSGFILEISGTMH